MTDWFSRLAARRRLSIVFWGLNAVLAGAVLAFAMRGLLPGIP